MVGILRNTKCVSEKPISTSGESPVLGPLNPAGWVGHRLPPTSPGEHKCSPKLSPEPNATDVLRCDGAGNEEKCRAPHGSSLSGPETADFLLFPPPNWARSMCTTFFAQTTLTLGT